MGAALAYCTLLSLSPLLIIATAVGGLFFGQRAAREEIVAQIRGLVGRDGAVAVQSLLKSANAPAQDIFATLVVVPLWVYYSVQVFLPGAEFTWVCAHECGSKTAQCGVKPRSSIPSHSGGALATGEAMCGGVP